MKDGENLLIRAGKGYSRVVADGVQMNFCTLQYRYKANSAGSWSQWFDDLTPSETDSDSAQKILPDFSKKISYTVELMVVDTLGNTGPDECLYPVGTALATLHLGAGGDRVGICKYAENPGLDMGAGIYMNGQVIHDMAPESLLDLVYPVGSIYLSYNHTSPASILGGTWERIKDRFLLAAGDTYIAGDIGGEAAHTLTIDEMPSHGHKSLYEYASGTYGFGYSWTTPGALSSSDKVTSSGIEHTGGGKAHNNMPPYLTVYVWKRVA